MAEVGQSEIAPVRRSIVTAVGKVFIPQETHLMSPDGLSQATDFVRDGGGLILAYTHPSKREGADIMVWLLGQPVLKTKPIVSPVSYHTYSRSRAGYEASAWMTGSKLYPVVTPETLQKMPGQADQLKRKGLFDYLKNAAKTLREGGIVPLALQAAGEQKTLGEPTQVLSALVATAQMKKVERWGVLFMGIDFSQAGTARAALKEFNLGKKARINVGEFFSGPQALEAAHHNLRDLDPWAFTKLAGLMPLSYSSPKTAPAGA